jgi:hypothetical protein
MQRKLVTHSRHRLMAAVCGTHAAVLAACGR